MANIDIKNPGSDKSALVAAFLGVNGGGIPAYQGFIATNGKLSENKFSAPNNQCMGRKRHYLKAPMTAGARFFYDNFYGPTETGSGGNLTLSASVEYPVGSGTCYLLDFGGSSSTVIADRGTGIGVYTGPTIPAGAFFDELPYSQFTNGALYSQTSSRIDGAQIASSVTNRTTTGGSPLAASDFIYCATAIVGETTSPSELIIGDSRDCVAYQLYGVNDPGAVSRILGGTTGYCNIACSGAAMYQYRDDSTSRLTKYAAFATHIVYRGFINDLNGGSNSAACQTILENNITKWGPGKINIANTVEPFTTSATVSISALSQVGGVATATVVSTSGLQSGQIVTIAGATPSAYNGGKTITVTSGTTFTFAIAGGTTSPATGTITYNDNWSSLVNQTTWDVTKNAARVSFNNIIRGGTIVGMAYYWDTADAVESSRDSGLWFVGSGQALTNDGLHGNTRAQGKFYPSVNLGLVGITGYV